MKRELEKMQPGLGGLVKLNPALRSFSFPPVNLVRLETTGEMAEGSQALNVAGLVGNSRGDFSC